MFASPLRVCVFTTLVTVASTVSTIMCEPSRLSAAGTEESPTQVVATAGDDFALKLYRQLAKQTPDKNLFFSPYSMTSALGMALEGARGNTADEMARRSAFRRRSPHGRRRPAAPWNTAIIHAGMAELNRQLCGTARPARRSVSGLRSFAKSWTKRRNAREQGGDSAATPGKSTRRDGNSPPSSIRCSLRWTGTSCAWPTPVGREGLSVPPRVPRRPANELCNRRGRLDGLSQCPRRRTQGNQRLVRETDQRPNPRRDAAGLDYVADPARAGQCHLFPRTVAEPFDAKSTKDEVFTLRAKDTVQVPMMQKRHVVNGYAAFNADGSLFETPGEYDPGGMDQPKLYPDDRGFSPPTSLTKGAASR